MADRCEGYSYDYTEGVLIKEGKTSIVVVVCNDVVVVDDVVDDVVVVAAAVVVVDVVAVRKTTFRAKVERNKLENVDLDDRWPFKFCSCWIETGVTFDPTGKRESLLKSKTSYGSVALPVELSYKGPGPVQL